MDLTLTSTIESLDLYPIATQAGVSPQMAIGVMPSRPALLISIRDTDGCFGWGEVWANFPPRAHLHKAHLIEDVIAPALQGMAFIRPTDIQQQLRDKLTLYFLHVGQSQVFEHLLAGIDVALWDLALRKHNVGVMEFFDLQQTQAPCYASSINGADLAHMIPLAAERGQRYFKIKIGFQPDFGEAIVNEAAKFCPNDCRLMIDSNQSFDLTQAISALQSLQDHDLLFAEEPLPADAPLNHWEQLASATSIPLAGGENLYGVDRFIEMANSGLSVVQPDVAKWGGLSGALALAELLPSGVQLWPHFMGTALGQLASLAITAIVGDPAVCEMDVNKNPLRTELCGDIINIQNGRVPLYSGPGLVPVPLPDALTKFALPPC